ncbi:MAG TPA: phospho-N-acetylmuramoyl-pentapeptide-transferase [Rhodothermales bacterium]|nr:phospho-N-acetylmuramoyl-pentapeptide-transferase [Rhodothermales bacterium]
MLYYFLIWLEQTYEPPGFQMFHFITVRVALAAVTALLISLFFGKKMIGWLQKRQFGETVRSGADAGVVDHSHKRGTPSMGGIIILASVLGATFLWGAIAEMGILLVMLATIWMGGFGFADDYIKIVKKNKAGLAGRTKLAGQFSIGLLVGYVLYFHNPFNKAHEDVQTITNLPFVKDRVFDYFPDTLASLLGFDLGWLVYIGVVIFIMMAVSNAVNLTDGLDGLAGGVSAFVAAGLVVFSYVAGNAKYANFLGILHLSGAGELTVFAAALAAACMGFLWYNSHPAQVFMGDTGSLALGAAIATLALMVKTELLLPLLCSVFFMETISVILQTSYFKYTKKRFGEGRRIFRMAPLHHHFEAMGLKETKIVTRFWIITAISVIMSLLTLRIR